MVYLTSRQAAQQLGMTWRSFNHRIGRHLPRVASTYRRDGCGGRAFLYSSDVIAQELQRLCALRCPAEPRPKSIPAISTALDV